ncbi:MAG: hypothetical protein RLZZ458_1328 [Planctomycetota bacterium]|jgi:hypothetical protein
MNRIALKLFSPDDTTALAEDHSDNSQGHSSGEPYILPFQGPRRTTVLSGRFMPAVERARILHENTECPDCGKSTIQPLELNDALISPRSRLPIPGTATIIGFHCEECSCEWPVFQISRRSI